MKKSITDKVKEKIKKMKEGRIFSAKDLSIKDGTQAAVEMALSRMVKKDEIVKVGKGLFSKPKMSKFGRINFSADKLIEMTDKKTTIVTTGHTLFNNLGISTQVPSKTTIKVRNSNSALKNEKNKFVKFKVDNKLVSHQKKDRHLVELLEALSEIKTVFDASSDDVVIRVTHIISKLQKRDVVKLSDLSIHYRPSVRAILGAILEISKKDELHALSRFLRSTLNKSTKYKLGLTAKSLPNHKEWNIQ